MSELTTKLIDLISSYHYSTASEKELQCGLEMLFTDQGLRFSREYHLSSTDVIDFLIESPQCKIGLECKTKGGVNAVMRQLARYVSHGCINELIVVTTRSGHTRIEPTLNGVPIYVIYLRTFL